MIRALRGVAALVPPIALAIVAGAVRVAGAAPVGVKPTVAPASRASVPAPSGGDDTPAFDAAIVAANGGVVSVPGSGTYLVRAIAVTRAGTTIDCTGTPAATLALRPLAAGDGAPILDVTSGGFTLRGCILDGNRRAQTPEGFQDSYRGRAFRAAIKVDGRHRGLAVERATFRNVHGAAIATRDASAIRVTGCVFRDNAFEALFATTSTPVSDPAGEVDGVVFTGNAVINARSRHPSVNANGLLVSKGRDVSITGNRWDGFERNAIKLERCRQVTVKDNRIRNGDLGGFAGIGLQNGARQVVISGNDVSEAGSGIDASLVVGGQHASGAVEDVVITGNTITRIKKGGMADGIRILGYGPGTTDVVIAGNTIHAVPRFGINLRQFRSQASSPTFARITIRDNRLRSVGVCGDWFDGTAVPPREVTDAGNRCD